MVRCTGCYQNFQNSQALRSHAQQVQNPACQQAYADQVAAALQALELNYARTFENETANNADDILAEPEDSSEFAGDFYGTYDVNDLPGLNDNDEEMEAEFTTSINSSDDTASDISDELDCVNLEYPDSDYDDDDEDRDFRPDESFEPIEHNVEILE